MLHIVNGDSTRVGLERSKVPGTFVSWSDVLHEGPTPAGLSSAQWRRVRVQYLASSGREDRTKIAGQYAREDAAMERWREHEEVIFWFEHDLYDQLLLIRHLEWLSRIADRGRTRFSLVCEPVYLGPLQPKELDALFPTRAPIVDAQLDLGARAWRAFCASEPHDLETLVRGDTSALPFLAGALGRHFEDYPSVKNGLSRSEAQILTAIDEGSSTLHEAFRACAKMERRIFMGDSTFQTIADGLASGAHPLMIAPPRGSQRSVSSDPVSLNDAGREVLGGRADHVRLNGIDKWMGGVHLTADRCYRWNGELLIVDG